MSSKAKNVLSNYVFMSKTKEILDIGYASEENVILFGPGGYGKSEYTEDFLKDKGHTPFVLTMGSGMTTDRLFGGVDIKLLNETGKLEYLVENSWMNQEYVIFEELFDAPDFVLEQLKDILSSGHFRNGSQVFKIKTKFIVCNTNRTREEFAKNASLSALLERFPLERRVCWKSHTAAAYTKLLEARLGKADPLLVYVLDAYNSEGHKISPRIAIKAQKMMAANSSIAYKVLAHIAEFKKDKSILENALKEFKKAFEFQNKAKEAGVLLEKLSKVTVEDLKTVPELTAFKKELDLLSEKNKEISLMDVSTKDSALKVEVLTELDSFIVESREKVSLIFS